MLMLAVLLSMCSEPAGDKPQSGLNYQKIKNFFSSSESTEQEDESTENSSTDTEEPVEEFTDSDHTGEIESSGDRIPQNRHKPAAKAQAFYEAGVKAFKAGNFTSAKQALVKAHQNDFLYVAPLEQLYHLHLQQKDHKKARHMLLPKPP